MSSASQVRQNFHDECENAINDQIHLLLQASYVYLGMACHFNRDDVALQGFYHYFKKRSEEEREHAYKFQEYLNKRGGRIVLKDIKAPSKQAYESPKEAVTDALNLEKQVNQSLLDLHKIASKHEDPNLTDFIESHYLQEQVDDIKELADNITNINRVGTGLGEFIFDQKLHD